MKYSHLVDHLLLSETKALAKEERVISADLLHRFKEIENRRLFSDLGYGSLYDYLTKELKYSEPAASRRVKACRLLSELPKIEEQIKKGSVSLSNLSMASAFFKNENIIDSKVKEKVIDKIQNTTYRECEKILFSMGTMPVIPKESVKLVSEKLFSITMNISQKTLEAFDEAKKLISLSSNDESLNYISQLAIERIRNKKFHLTNSTESKSTNPRYVTAGLKKEIYLKDHGKCQKCNSTYKLNFDHIKPYSLGGKSSSENLRLLCSSCNQRARIRAKL